MTVFLTFLAISFVVFWHECGHLFFAKLGGIGVIEFSVGMGPSLYGFRYKGTLYSFRLLPIGGFVKLAGLDDSENELDESVYFQNRPLKHRFLTIFAGSGMNIILGYLIFFFMALFIGAQFVSPVIKNVVPEGAAYEAGMRSGDRLVSLNGNSISNVEKDFISVVKGAKSSVSVVIERENAEMVMDVTPYFDEEHQVSRIGVELETAFKKVSFFGAFGQAWGMLGRTFYLVYYNFEILFSGKASMGDLSGPIGIIQFGAHQLAQSVGQFLSLMAFISVSLGIINLFPIPVLDGGHLVFLGYEAIFGKPVPKKVEAIMSNAFAICLISLMVFIIFNDIVSWSDRTDLLNTLPEK